MTPHDTGQLRLEVENFGPIAQGDVELRPLTVFFGPSDAGKSYLAKLIYALHRVFATPAFARRKYELEPFFGQMKKAGDMDGLVEWLARHLESDPGDGGESALPDDLAGLARTAVQSHDVGSALTRELLRVMGAETPGELLLGRETHGKLTLGYALSKPDGRPLPFRHVFEISRSAKLLSHDPDIPEDAPIHLGRSSYWARRVASGFLHRDPKPPNEGSSVAPMRLLVLLTDLALPGTVGALSASAYYLPAGRSGLVEAHGAVVGSALDRMTQAGPRREAGSLSGVMADFIRESFVDLGSKPPGWQGGKTLARRVEETIIRGTVRTDELDNGASSVAYRPTGWAKDLPVTRSSSMVTEVIPLVLYLRHYATPGSTIIIEEPEAHMHPAMQVRMVAAIAAMVEAGIRVTITTHSEWILSALANLVRSAGLPESERQDIGGDGPALPSDEVGVWQFLPEADAGTATRELPLDSEDSMYNAGYPEVGRALYSDWATIVSRLQGD